MGTPHSIADKMHEWLQTEACDGFNIIFSNLPDLLTVVCDRVVPALQRRGILRRAHIDTTLREQLGLSRPANRCGVASCCATRWALACRPRHRAVAGTWPC